MATDDVKIRIGLRRLYRTHGCEIETGSLEKEFRLGENFSVSVRMGSSPQFGLYTGGFSCRYLAPGIDKLEVNYRYEPDIGKTELAGQSLTEIIVSREISVDTEFRDAFERGEAAFQNKAADLAYTESAHLVPALEFVGGLIGLRIDRQFLAELINETPVTWRNDGPHLQFLYKGPKILGGIQLTRSGGDYLRGYLDIGSQHQDDNILNWGRILGWLQKAWAEDELVTKFLWFFIPLECVLGSVQVENRARAEACKLIRMLIKEHAGDQKQQLMDAFNRITENLRPSLEERFSAFARSSQCESCEADILAFRRFNRLRNGLLHRGESKIQLHVESPDTEQVSGIQDIAERYISKAIFGDFHISKLGSILLNIEEPFLHPPSV